MVERYPSSLSLKLNGSKYQLAKIAFSLVINVDPFTEVAKLKL